MTKRKVFTFIVGGFDQKKKKTCQQLILFIQICIYTVVKGLFESVVKV